MRPRKNQNDLVIGGKQLAVLQSIFTLKEEAFGGGIYIRMAEDGERIHLPQVYSILSKLEIKGLVSHYFSEPGHRPGERRRKVYEITGKGHRVLKASLSENPRTNSGNSWVFPGLGAD